jgi:hypothetical protein
VHIFGFGVRGRHAAWLELLALQVFMPECSFLGHLSGILIALLYHYLIRSTSRGQRLIRAFLAWTEARGRGGDDTPPPYAAPHQQQQPRFAGSGPAMNDRYAAGVRQLYDMGFHDRSAAHRALVSSDGDVARAAELMLQNGER